MKERLFRAKKIKDGDWVVGYHFCISGNHRILLPESFEESGHQPYLGYVVDPATIGQGIPDLDKAGKRIFEGDIVEHAGKRFVIEYIEKYHRFAGVRPGIAFAGFGFGYCEIIGNIHDNPELLEGEQT